MKISEQQLQLMMSYLNLSMQIGITLTDETKVQMHDLYNQILNQQSKELKEVE